MTYSGPHGTLRFRIDSTGERVSADWLDAAPPGAGDVAANVLLGPIISYVLRLRGKLALHGSVVDVGSRAVVVLADTGTGKSTVAAAMARRGHAVLSDDVAALAQDESGTWVAHPGYPRLRLAPALGEAEKRFVELSCGELDGPWRFQDAARPVAALYELRRDPTLAATTIAPVTGAARLATLLRHAKPTPLPLAPELRRRDLDRLGRLAAAVPTRLLRCPEGLDGMPGICAAVAEDVGAAAAA